MTKLKFLLYLVIKSSLFREYSSNLINIDLNWHKEYLFETGNKNLEKNTSIEIHFVK